MKLVERLKRNAGRRNFGVNTEGFEFKKLEELAKDGEDVIHIVNGFIEYTTQVQEKRFLIIDTARKALINVPTHRNSIINELLQEDDAVEIIKGGGLGYRIYKYKSKFGNECCSIEFIDVEKD